MLVPSCPTMHRARPTLLLPLLLVLGLILHLTDAQSKWTAGFHVGLKCCVLMGWGRGDNGLNGFLFYIEHNHSLKNPYNTYVGMYYCMMRLLIY